ncbi:hypothetical protein EDB92DRAFT_1941006 [Lactarius akahatsu]|uniref:Uncharacterized protein n=1 Tax=Lactarius akahatsu TaxID=416441 RepID=A0AAD4LR82_9AGAM|nr:hypothetical protein EDB92DRAFT_1941006 [Lactarius akahatsu]
MSSLPSFVELMSSLGLEDGASLSWNPSSSPYLRPRFHSDASTSSDLDDDEQQHNFNTGAYLFVSTDCDRRDRVGFMESDIPRVSRHGKGRYSPYSVTSITRKGSLPTLSDASISTRAPSTSPVPSPSSRATRGLRSSPSGRLSRRGSETWSQEADIHATTPISTFLRRKSVQMSPTSASFPRSASDEPMAPVAIPALPALLSSFIFPPPAPELSESPAEDSDPPGLMATADADAN